VVSFLVLNQLRVVTLVSIVIAASIVSEPTSFRLLALEIRIVVELVSSLGRQLAFYLVFLICFGVFQATSIATTRDHRLKVVSLNVIRLIFLVSIVRRIGALALFALDMVVSSMTLQIALEALD